MSEYLPPCPACDQPLPRTEDGKEFKMACKPYWQWRHLLEVLRQLWVPDDCCGEAPLLELLCRTRGWFPPKHGDVYTINENGVRYEIRRVA